MAGRPTIVRSDYIRRTTLGLFATPILGAVIYIKGPGDNDGDGNLSNEISHMRNLRYVIFE